jgi:undecaprenyl-diphosphatase
MSSLPAVLRTRILLSALAAVLFAWLVREVGAGTTWSFDQDARATVHSLSAPVLTSAMRFFSFVGEPVTMSLVCLAVFVVFGIARSRRSALSLAFAIAGATLLDATLKECFKRPRPASFFDYPEPVSFSLPSGHALFSLCILGTLAWTMAPWIRSRQLRIALWLLTAGLVAVIGYSRIYLGVHYPSDVIGGYLLGIAWLPIATLPGRQHLR